MVAAMEELPLGVGRVPKWWMEITPHHTLDEEDAEARRLAEDQMDYYYMQLAAADEAGLLNPDGTPKDGVDMTSWAPSNPWNGRSASGNAHATAQTPGGRNFQPGQAVIDPKLFGIYLNDPDYKAYLTGAKLPPGYFEKMGEFAHCKEGGAQGILNNLKQTDYGRYGRQAENPAFKPAWAKKKLRSTSTGTNIRQGQYDDSPNKFINRRRVQPQVDAPNLEETQESYSRPQSPVEHVAAPIQQHEPEPVHEPKTIVRTVRTVVRTDEGLDEDSPAPKAQTLSEYMHKAPPVQGADQKLQEQKEKLARLKELQRQQQLLKEQREVGTRQNQVHPAAVEQDEESYEEEIIEEEVDDDYTEGSYEEEIIEDDPQEKGEDDDELNSLQAILAAKQAELQRLKAQISMQSWMEEKIFVSFGASGTKAKRFIPLRITKKSAKMETIAETRRRGQTITATEDDEEGSEDEIPGPSPSNTVTQQNGTSINKSNNNSSVGSSSRRLLGIFSRKGPHDELQISQTAHKKVSGDGILADTNDIIMNPNDFANGCKLLQAAARGDILAVRECLKRADINFRDYDRRTCLHIAASEGHLKLVQFLVETCHARINRSDRWGGSPLDDAHRHQHVAVAEYLRHRGAVTGSGNRVANLIKASADGDVEEVCYCIKASVDINGKDYDKRTPLHLAASEGHLAVVKALIDAGADVNAQDRWSRRPLDDASAPVVVQVLVKAGAKKSAVQQNSTNTVLRNLDSSGQRALDNMRVDFEDLEMIDKIGSGAFGEIYKCRWRGTFVAAKIIRSAKIQNVWTTKRLADADADDAIDAMDKEAEDLTMASAEKDMALSDFRREISVLKSLRHPNIVLLLAYSTTADYECIISELLKCSLLDVFKSHLVQGTKMPKRKQIAYATQLALGMNYLHTCKPPIIHRDLKPANLLLDHSGSLKISDFGLSKLRPDPGTNESEVFTMTGETGSYRFMAPEVFLHQEYNETVDIYSYAMIVYQLLVGLPPWAQLAGLDAVRRASEEGDRPIIPRDVDIRLNHLLRDCWDEKTNTRPAFAKVLDTLSNYSKDVFHQDSREQFDVNEDARCGCRIM